MKTKGIVRPGEKLLSVEDVMRLYGVSRRQLNNLRLPYYDTRKDESRYEMRGYVPAEVEAAFQRLSLIHI